MTSRVKEQSAIVYFIDFDVFCANGGFFRNPNHRDKTILLNNINRDESFLVFISHCWLRPSKNAKKAHPDNEENDKWKLCVDGIQWMKKHLAPRMKHCYVWLDYSCIDQDNRASLHRSLKCYDKIVECCDAILTPISDRENIWDLPRNYVPLEDYKALLWNGDHPHAYLSRAWCRVEMLYAANIPIMNNSNGDARHTMFEAGLAHACRMNRRLHVIFGHREQARMNGPLFLSPLQNSYFVDYNPLKGKLTVTTDRVHIQNLIEKLRHYLDANRVKVGYEGDRNATGQREGYGVMKQDNGDVYEGQWCDDVREGKGIEFMSNGDVYEGDWWNDQMHGVGRYTFSGGSVYEGDFRGGSMHGTGVFHYFNGNRYEGGWKQGRREGPGVFHWPNGDRFEGIFKKDHKSGAGVFHYANGDREDGFWIGGDQHGTAYLTLTTGEVWLMSFQYSVEVYREKYIGVVTRKRKRFILS